METKKQCPNCQKMVFHETPICRFCKYDFTKKRSPKVPKSPKAPKVATVTKEPAPDMVLEPVMTAPPASSARQARYNKISVPALGRLGDNNDTDYSWLHFHNSVVNDDTLLAWALHVREEWSNQFGEYLLNHALGYLAKTLYWPHHENPKRRNLSDKPLAQHAMKIVTLLGGEDW